MQLTTNPWIKTFGKRQLRFSAPGPDSELEPETLEQKTDPDVYTSGESAFESAEEEPSTIKLKGREEIPSPRTEQEEEISLFDNETDTNPLASSNIWEGTLYTEPRPKPPINPLENLLSNILNYNLQPEAMANQPNTSSIKEISLNKPEPYDGKRDGFQDFIQDVEMYMDTNFETYDTDLKKIAFVLSFMQGGAAKTWKRQFIDHAKKVTPAPLPKDLYGTYDNFKKDLYRAFAMFDSVGDARDELRALKMKPGDSIDEHVAKFRILAAAAAIEETNPLIIDMFRESLTRPIENRLIKLETPLNNFEDWIKWALIVDHQYQRINRASERTRTNQRQEKKPQKQFYFPRRDPNAMDIDKLSVEERTKLMKEGKCFKCKKNGHRANECPENDGKKKEEPKKKMNGKELYTHVRTMFKEMSEEDREEFMKGAEEAGF